MLTRKLYLLSGTVSQKKGEALDCHVPLATACLVPTSLPAASLVLLAKVNKHVTPREWLYSFLPEMQFYAPEAFISHAERFEWEFNFST